MKLDLNEFLKDKFMKAQYRVDKEAYDKIQDEVDKDKLIKSRVAQTLLVKHYDEINKHIGVETIHEDGREYLQFHSEIVIMSNLQFYQLMLHLLSIPQRESVNLATRLESFIELETKKLENDGSMESN